MTQREMLAIPVAGICNVHIGPFSTADAHFTLIRQRLEKAGVHVAHAVVPEGLGLAHSLEKTYKAIEAEILATANTHPDHDIVLLAHSLGGLFGREFLGRVQFEDQRFTGMVALGSPFGELKHYSGLWGAENKANDINDFNKRGAELMPTSEGGPRVTQIASTVDLVVPPEVALTPIPHASPDLHLFTTPLEIWRAHRVPDAQIHHYPNPLWLEHNLMLVAPSIDHLGMHFRSPADIATNAVLQIAQQPAVVQESTGQVDHLLRQFGVAS